MTPEHIRTIYADLLDARADEETITLLGDLDTLYAPPIPASASVSFAQLLAWRDSASSATGQTMHTPGASTRLPIENAMPVPSITPHSGHLRQWLAFAAAVLAFAVVGALLVVVFGSQGRDDEPRIAAPIPPATTAVAREILYISQDDATHRSLRAVRSDGAGTRLVSDGSGGEIWGADWSPDGSRIAFFSSMDGPFSIYTTNAAGGDLRRLTTSDIKTLDSDPIWSPDGTRIAFLRTRGIEHEPTDLMVMNADGSGLLSVTSLDSGQAATMLTWSPDGTRLAFALQRVAGDAIDSDVYAVNADGTDLVQLSDTAKWNLAPSWSPDGRRIVYAHSAARSDDTSDIYLVDSTGGKPQRLTFGDGWSGAPAWSPDGSWIAFSSWTETRQSIRVMRPDGTDQQEINAFDGADGPFGLHWSQDSQQLAFMQATGDPNDRASHADLVVIDRNGANRRVLAENAAIGAQLAWSSVAIDAAEATPEALSTVSPPAPALDDLRPLEPGEGWFVRYQVWSDWRQDDGALMHWAVERIERTLPDGTRQYHVTAWDDTGTTVAELISDGERWWWEQRGWVEAGNISTGLAPLPLELNTHMREPETAYSMLTTRDPATAEQFTDGDVAVTRFYRNRRDLVDEFGPFATDAFYEIRQSTGPDDEVLLTRWVVVDDQGAEIDLSRHILEHLVRTSAATMEDADFVIPSVPTSPRPMQYALPPDPLPAGFAIDRHWSDYPVGTEHLSIAGPEVALDVAISASRGGHDPRQLDWNAARAGNSVHTIDSDTVPVTYLTKPDSAVPFLAIWDDGRYRFELSAIPSDAAGWDEATLRTLVAALSHTGL